MQTADIIVKSEIPETFRAEQLKAIFDLNSMGEKLSHEWKVELPIDEFEWNIGMIVGPSGAGKTTIAKQVFEAEYHTGFTWSKDKAVIDDFPKECKTTGIVAALNSVGFSSPPSWLKPYHVLSNGEKFRVELARAIVEYKDKMFVMDEFTSVVDRKVAQVGSVAVSKAIRRAGGKMIALSCHFDIIDWLQPDWVFDLRDMSFSRGCLRQRPKIDIEIATVEREAWPMFSKHHYLSGNLHRASKCFGAFISGQMVGFAAVLPLAGYKGRRRVHRIVVQPDFQGVGIAKAFLNTLGKHYKGQGLRLSISSSHPGIMRGMERNEKWKCSKFYKNGVGKPTRKLLRRTARTVTPLASFEYIG